MWLSILPAHGHARDDVRGASGYKPDAIATGASTRRRRETPAPSPVFACIREVVAVIKNRDVWVDGLLAIGMLIMMIAGLMIVLCARDLPPIDSDETAAIARMDSSLDAESVAEPVGMVSTENQTDGPKKLRSVSVHPLVDSGGRGADVHPSRALSIQPDGRVAWDVPKPSLPPRAGYVRSNIAWTDGGYDSVQIIPKTQYEPRVLIHHLLRDARDGVYQEDRPETPTITAILFMPSPRSRFEHFNHWNLIDSTGMYQHTFRRETGAVQSLRIYDTRTFTIELVR